MGLISGLERSPGGRKWQLTPVFLSGEFHGQGEPGRLQPMGQITQSQTQMSNINGKTTYICMYVCVCPYVWVHECIYLLCGVNM